ncbi:MAG: hypothetical protein IKZ52_03005 [Bacteroidales bacterium]|nr:hypothetical protein [Bacteroidales bacterium]
MKKILKYASLTALVMTMVFAFSAFTPVNDTLSEKSCKVTVKYSNGDLADNVTVSAYYKGFGGGYHDFKTNDNGVVTLTWDAHDIEYLLVKGDKYEVDYSDGKSYTLTLKKKHKYD